MNTIEKPRRGLVAAARTNSGSSSSESPAMGASGMGAISTTSMPCNGARADSSPGRVESSGASSVGTPPASAMSRKSMVGLTRGRASPVVGDNGSETVATGADPGAIRRVVAGPSALRCLRSTRSRA